MATLIANLNRKITGTNGVTYSNIGTWLGEQAAANAWAGTTGLDTQGALNKKASGVRTPDNFKDLQGVCNEIAGTTGLGIQAASDLW